MRITNVNTVTKPQSSHHESKKIGSKLSAGDVFKAEIIDIKQNTISLLLADGNHMTARLEQNLEAKMGQMMYFKVQSNTDRQIVLQMLMQNTENLKMDLIIDALMNAKISVNDKNIELVQGLLENQLPLDKENIQKLLYHMTTNDNATLDKLLFLMNNELPLTQKNIQQLDGYMNHTTQLQSQLEMLQEAIINIKNPHLKSELMDLFLDNTVDNQSIKQQLSEEKHPNSINLEKFSVDQSEPKISQQNEVIIQKFIKDNHELLKNEMEGMLEGNTMQQKKTAVEQILNRMPQGKLISQLFMKDDKLFEIFINELHKNDENPMRILDDPFGQKEKDFVVRLKEQLFIDIKDQEKLQNLDQYFKHLYNKIVEAKQMITSSNETSENHSAAKILTSIQDNLEFLNQLARYQSFIQIPLKMEGQMLQGDLYVFREKKDKRISKDQASVLLSLDFENIGHIEAYIQKNYRSISCQFRTNYSDIQKILQQKMIGLKNQLSNKGYTLDNVSYKLIEEPFDLLKSEPEESMKKQERKRYSFDMRV